MTRVLVTGAASFTARHLVPLLAADPDTGDLFGTDLPPAGPGTVDYRSADVTDRSAITRVIRETGPDRVFHLAGIAAPEEDVCRSVNVEGTRHLLEACAALDPPPQVVSISSAAVYGHTRPDETPVREDTPLRPTSPYGVSKAAAEALARSFHETRRLPVLVIRPFNLVGPGLPPGLAPSDFADQVRRIRDGGLEARLWTGLLTPRRDFVDVRDAVRAYVLLARSAGCYGRTFNVGTGRPVAVGDLLEELLRVAGVEATVETDPARLRPVDVPEQVADLTALRAAISWEPEIPLSRSLRDMLAARVGPDEAITP